MNRKLSAFGLLVASGVLSACSSDPDRRADRYDNSSRALPSDNPSAPAPVPSTTYSTSHDTTSSNGQGYWDGSPARKNTSTARADHNSADGSMSDDNIPSNVRSTLQKYADGSVSNTMRRTVNGQTVYEARTTINGKSYKVCADQNGDLVSIRRMDWTADAGTADER